MNKNESFCNIATFKTHFSFFTCISTAAEERLIENGRD